MHPLGRHSAALAGLFIAGPLAIAQTEPKHPVVITPSAEIAPSGAAEVARGIRRIVQSALVPATPGQERAAGKSSFPIDSQTGAMIVPTQRFYLPDGWNWSSVGGGDVDSLGRAIVNRPLGWTAWTQDDVDALRATIQQQLADAAGRGPGVAPEADAMLGNYIGQAVARGIDVSDLVDLAANPAISPTVAESILERMHAYELARYEAGVNSLGYTPSSYPASVLEFVEASGYSIEDVLAVEDLPAGGSAGSRSVPSGCYFRQPGAGLGLNLLVDSTTIWQADGTDDAQADIPLGFGMRFYECDTSALNTAVRVSSNGYITFYQQGGGATNGVNFVNEPIGTPASPNGFVAGYWDDMAILNQSNIPDRVSWKIEGTVGTRVLTVEYLSISRLGGTTLDYHTFQIQFFERRDQIPGLFPVVLAYTGNPNDWQADTEDAATVGLENFDGTSGECLEDCAPLTGIPQHNYIFYPLANDTCGDAVDLIPNESYSSDLRFAYNETTTCSNANPDRWFKFQAPCAGTLTIDTCGTNDIGGVDQGIDTVISMHTACPSGGGALIGCDDDGAAGCVDAGLVRDSRLSTGLINAQVVYIRVTSFIPSTTRGAFFINATFVPSAPPPANDNCANATSIGTPSSIGGNLYAATIDGDGTSYEGRDVWYTITPPLAGTLRVTSCGTNDRHGIDRGVDTVIALHAGCPATPASEIAVNDDPFTSACGDSDLGFWLDADVRGSVRAGEDIRIRVLPFADFPRSGDFQIHTFLLVADLDADCDVDLQDLATLLSGFGATGSGLYGDIDGDGAVTVQDLAYLLSNYGSHCP